MDPGLVYQSPGKNHHYVNNVLHIYYSFYSERSYRVASILFDTSVHLCCV